MRVNLASALALEAVGAIGAERDQALGRHESRVGDEQLQVLAGDDAERHHPVQTTPATSETQLDPSLDLQVPGATVARVGRAS